MPRNVDCPRCEESLEPTLVEEAGVRFESLRCAGCEGSYFRTGDLEKVDDIVAPSFLEVRRIPAAAAQQEPLLCPVCPQHPRMSKVEHHRDSKVVMDVCAECGGTWLDKGELQAIQTESLIPFLANNIRWLASLRNP